MFENSKHKSENGVLIGWMYRPLLLNYFVAFLLNLAEVSLVIDAMTLSYNH